MNTLINIAVGVLVLVWILARQLTPRPVKQNSRTVLIIAVVGIVQVASYLQAHAVPAGELFAAVVGVLVAAAIAWPRATVNRIWQDASGQWWRQGGAMTLVLWLVAVGLHLLIGFVVPGLLGVPQGGDAGFEQVTLVLYLAVSLGAQGYFLNRRIAALSAADVTTAPAPVR